MYDRVFTASNTNGRKAEVRKCEGPCENSQAYSAFTWIVDFDYYSVKEWKEHHDLSYEQAFKACADWVK